MTYQIHWPMSTEIGIALFIGALIFNAGGFVWLATNHQKSANTRLTALEASMTAVKESLARIEGHLGLGG